MAYRDYWHCPICKGNFDHNEKCDCKNKYKEVLEYEDVSKKDAHRELQGVQG